jgi:branched-chain amino acid transport system substrate-binding protein
MANFFARNLKVKTIYILDDSGAYGVGIADAFQRQAEKEGDKVLGHDQLNPKEADYTTILTKIKGLKPDALYYGGVAQAGVKLAKQAYDIIPDVIKGGGDGVQGQRRRLPGRRRLVRHRRRTPSRRRPGRGKLGQCLRDEVRQEPDDYSITAYDGNLVALDAIKRVVESGKELNRSNVRNAMQATNLQTPQGVVSFDENGDIKDRTVSVFQYQKNQNYPDDDIIHQQKYLGAAPQS